ncbi:toxin-antitoxin system HicB family antitoxin [Allopusillimonas ginsengisoli]|uniref:toxin-antitoxin system HicB family antitoxin n=1 Tax=Allopusillimonas ginsengisoli TaxID=453575 RepID=UPI00101FFA0B|nr:toxin-antitoxin system HicB family antitoxin [Allopusillimonas ginsengisoli]TEA78667.1 toxin-antitoxin system HicB family antitoxin [Allopusillimonas ginsengisoli]
MNQFDPSLYTIEIKRIDSPDGLLYEAKVKEIPGVAGYAECAADAFNEARDALQMLHNLAHEQKREFPAPLAATDPDYNGRVTLRMSKSLHHRAALMAEIEGVSLNTLITEALSEKVFSFRRPSTSVHKEYLVYFRDAIQDFYMVQGDTVPAKLSLPKTRSYEIARSQYGDEAYSV